MRKTTKNATVKTYLINFDVSNKKNTKNTYKK